jgi:hypothetical protein
MTEQPDGLFWISEARLLEICRIKRATWRAWADEGLVEGDPGGAYDEADVLSVVLILALRDHLSAKDTALAWQEIRRQGLDAQMIARARKLTTKSHLDLIIEPDTRIVRYATDDSSLARAVRFADDPRGVIVVAVDGKLRRVRDGFRILKEESRRPTERSVGRPKRTPAQVHQLRGQGP